MATYIIGDVQGCYIELQQLLEKIAYNPQQDRLGFVGDLVNRGPDTVKVLRFLRELTDPIIVLGNHDLYALILGYELMPIDSYQHTLYEFMQAPDRFELLEWLRHLPLLQINHTETQLFVHAGIPPQWSLQEANTHAREVETALRGENFKKFLADLFGNQPGTWADSLQGQSRLRYITNALTRMRFCTNSGELDFSAQRKSDITDDRFKPWYEWRDPNDPLEIYFGHWAYLNGKCDQPNTYALDTGCAWGHELSAIRLEDKQHFSVPASNKLTNK